jgi:hypothetical protein
MVCYGCADWPVLTDVQDGHRQQPLHAPRCCMGVQFTLAAWRGLHAVCCPLHLPRCAHQCMHPSAGPTRVTLLPVGCVFVWWMCGVPPQPHRAAALCSRRCRRCSSTSAAARQLCVRAHLPQHCPCLICIGAFAHLASWSGGARLCCVCSGAFGDSRPCKLQQGQPRCCHLSAWAARLVQTRPAVAEPRAL